MQLILDFIIGCFISLIFVFIINYILLHKSDVVNKIITSNRLKLLLFFLIICILIENC